MDTHSFVGRHLMRRTYTRCFAVLSHIAWLDYDQDGRVPLKDVDLARVPTHVSLTTLRRQLRDLIADGFVKPFVEGAMTRLGERTADAGWEKLADIARRMRAARTGANGRFEIEDAPSKAQFHITGDLPDEAFQALTEINLSIPEYAGNVFVWDHEAGRWRPVL